MDTTWDDDDDDGDDDDDHDDDKGCEWFEFVCAVHVAMIRNLDCRSCSTCSFCRTACC